MSGAEEAWSSAGLVRGASLRCVTPPGIDTPRWWSLRMGVDEVEWVDAGAEE